jgi:hypothetical protein
MVDWELLKDGLDLGLKTFNLQKLADQKPERISNLQSILEKRTQRPIDLRSLAI